MPKTEGAPHCADHTTWGGWAAAALQRRLFFVRGSRNLKGGGGTEWAEQRLGGGGAYPSATVGRQLPVGYRPTEAREGGSQKPRGRDPPPRPGSQGTHGGLRQRA